jgi:hypothetical protein
MPPEHPAIDPDPPPPEAVVEFGPAPQPRRRWSTAGLGRDLAADRRLVPVAAALSAVALFASLISEWQVTTVNAELLDEGIGNRPLPTEVTDLGALGAGYLVGLFPLVAAVVLTMFGPPAGRPYLRLTGLSVAGTLLGLLVAITATLGGQSLAVARIYAIQLGEDRLTAGYGRGVWCAFAGVLLALLALHLAGRHLPAAAAADPGEPAGPEPEAVWTWRRPPGAANERRDPDQPLELTVAPARPFTPGDHDKPS